MQGPDLPKTRHPSVKEGRSQVGGAGQKRKPFKGIGVSPKEVSRLQNSARSSHSHPRSWDASTHLESITQEAKAGGSPVQDQAGQNSLWRRRAGSGGTGL